MRDGEEGPGRPEDRERVRKEGKHPSYSPVAPRGEGGREGGGGLVAARGGGGGG
jgi:hypothetical protein